MTTPTTKRPRKVTTPTDHERVLLKRQHTHAGVLHPADAWITVAPDTAEWLRGQSVIAKTPTPTTPTEANKD